MKRASRRSVCVRGARAAFTLLEIVVVVVIITILLVIAVPAFQSMIASSEEAMAESLLRSAVRGGREAALRSSGDDDGALVFFYEPGGRLTMVPCVRVGTITDEDAAGDPVTRDVFAPSATQTPIQLPKGWMVRAYAPAGVLDALGQWYERGVAPRYVYDNYNWVFPETGFYDPRDADSGEHRQTFMLRFQAGTGVMVTNPPTEALVISPRPSREDRNSNGIADLLKDDLLTTADYRRFVQGAMRARPSDFDAEDRRQALQDLLGDQSGDTVLTRSVSQLVLYNERDLAAALGVRADRATGTIYRGPEDDERQDGRPYQRGPRWIRELERDSDTVRPRINRWLSGDTNLDGSLTAGEDEEDVPATRVYTVDRYTGAIRQVEVQG